MSNFMSATLTTGIALSAAFLAVGLALVMVTGSTGYQAVGPDLNAITRQAFPRDAMSILRGLTEFKPFAIIEAGLLMLIATPVFRVAASAVLFILARDGLYVVVTLAVLGVLIVSIVLVQ